jgi:hypothetical protein
MLKFVWYQAWDLQNVNRLKGGMKEKAKRDFIL